MAKRTATAQGTATLKARFGPIVVVTTSGDTYRLEPGQAVEVPAEVLEQIRDSGLEEAVEVIAEG